MIEIHTSIQSTREAHETEKNAQKRKLTQISSDANAKKQKVEKVRSPEPACSQDFYNIVKRKKVVRPQLVIKTKVPIAAADEDVFQSFVKMCLEKRDDEDTRKILEKLEKLYSKLSLSQKNHDEFRLYIGNCQNKVMKGLSKHIFTPISDLYTEIKKRVQINSVKTKNNTDKVQKELEVSEENIEKIILLEDAITKCQKKIKELEDADVDLNDDDENSAYIQEDKYKKKLIQLCKELSILSGDRAMKKQISKKKIRMKDIKDDMTGIPVLDEGILDLINSNVNKINQLKHLETQGIADHIKIPEYFDVLKCIQKYDKERNFDLEEGKIKILAKQAFETVAKFLKKKRLDDTKFYMQSLIDDKDEDPALKDADLNKKLYKSKKEGDQRLEEIFKEYVDKEESLGQVDVDKQAKVNSEDYIVSDTENKDANENLSPEEETNKVSEKTTKSEPSLLEKSLIDDDKQETEAEIQPLIKDFDKTANVIEIDDDDVIVVSEDDDLNDSILVPNPHYTNKVSLSEPATVKTEAEHGKNLPMIHETTSIINSVSRNTLREKSVIVAKVDNSNEIEIID